MKPTSVVAEKLAVLVADLPPKYVPILQPAVDWDVPNADVVS